MPAKCHTLVTAGPTREPIDDVRDWGNIFTGRTGLDLALAFLDLGDVTLLTSNTQHAASYDGYTHHHGMLGIETFRSHRDLQSLLAERMTDPANPVHVVAMTAAVSDYAPAGVYRIIQKKTDPSAPGTETWTVQSVSAPKVKSTHGEIAVRGTATQKLIDLFRTDWHFTGTLIKFKLEVAVTEEQLVAIAEKSRLASNADLIVANTLAMARPEDNQPAAAYLIDPAGPVRVDRQRLALSIVDWTRRRRAQSTATPPQ